MSPFIRDAAVAIEDRRFYMHHGVDMRAIARAAVVNANEGELVEGGSTITQQLVKNLYVGTADTLRRKLDEASLAWQLEDRLSKDEILTKYLNTVYLGEGAYGVESAAQTYFSTDADELTLAAVRPAGRARSRRRTTSTRSCTPRAPTGDATWCSTRCANSA